MFFKSLIMFVYSCLHLHMCKNINLLPYILEKTAGNHKYNVCFITHANNIIIFCFLFLPIVQDRSSSSSYRAGSTDIPDPLSPLLPIVHRPR